LDLQDLDALADELRELSKLGSKQQFAANISSKIKSPKAPKAPSPPPRGFLIEISQ
jgi:hypothetical protein